MRSGILRRIFSKDSDNSRNLDRGSLSSNEILDMIKGVEELSDMTVKEVMVPRIDVVFISIQETTDRLIETIAQQGYSRYPVYKNTIDNVVGILYVKDLLKHADQMKSIEVKDYIRKPYFVPDSKRLDALLREFKRRKIHIAVAVDEYGGVSGIISMEDIIEVIVGDIQDEFDNETDDIIKIGDDIFLCDARAPIDEINESLGLHLPDEDFETIGGFVFELFGKIPDTLEKVMYRDDDKEIEFIVQDIEGHKINTVKIVIKDTPSLT